MCRDNPIGSMMTLHYFHIHMIFIFYIWFIHGGMSLYSLMCNHTVYNVHTVHTVILVRLLHMFTYDLFFYDDK